METVYSKKSECCGCTACFSVCPKKAISMLQDERGFLYPVIDKDKCIDCGKCRKVCAFVKKHSEDKLPVAYAAKHLDHAVQRNSRSGGVFTALTDNILSSGGVIYGVAQDKDYVVRHHRATDCAGRDQFRKSKYVQSELGEAFLMVKDDLAAGRKVLFSGTGCQCAGLKSFLTLSKADCSDLLLCDVICHGVPSPKFYQSYLKYLENKRGKKLAFFEFRDKQKYDWGTCVEHYGFSDGHECYSEYYANLFGDGLILRESCFSCPYSSIQRETDITLGDFWGVEELFPPKYYKDGCSLILVNTKKGAAMLEACKQALELSPVPLENVMQPRLRSSAEKPGLYEIFWEEYASYDFSDILRKYGRNSLTFRGKLKKGVWDILKFPYRCIRKIFRMIAG